MKLNKTANNMRIRITFIVTFLICSPLIIYLYIEEFKSDNRVSNILKPYIKLLRLEEHSRMDKMYDLRVREPVYGEDNIIFIESRCALNTDKVTGVGLDLNKRQACSIESAAYMNPNTTVYVLYTCDMNGSLEESLPHVKQIFTYPNVKMWKINMPTFLEGTPLEGWDFKMELSSSNWPVEHSSDIFRFLSLLKYGGTYLDLDIVVKKSLKNLGTDFIAKEDDNVLSASVLNFNVHGIGKKVCDMCVKEINFNFNGYIWTANGPDLVTRVMNSICETEEVSIMTEEKCQGIKILSAKEFTPVHYSNWMSSFSQMSVIDITKFESSYGVHMWNSLSKNLTINLLVPTTYGYLAEQYCPKVFLHSGIHF